MTITDADAAIDADLADLQLVDAAPAAEGPVVDVASTPCSAEEARTLIGRAMTAANDFYAAIGELLSRNGHVALGYDSPRQMLSQELSGMLTNPRTKQPLSDTHLRRMTRVAWLAWSISQATGIDVNDLEIPERQLRAISAASAGTDDADVIEDISDRLSESGVREPGEVNNVIREQLSTYPERAAKGAVGSKRDDGAEQDDAGRGVDSPGQPHSGSGGADRSGSSPGGAADASRDYEDESGDDGPADAPLTAPDPPKPPPSVTSFFDTAVPDGVPTVSDLDVSSALTHMRTAADIRRAMLDAVRILELLPAIAKIEKSVPHVIDAIDDDDLDAIRKELTGTETATKWATTTLAVIAEALEEVDTRIDEAI